MDGSPDLGGFADVDGAAEPGALAGYLDTVRGKSERWGHWLDRVTVGDKAPAEA